MTEVVGEAVIKIRADDSDVDKGIEKAGKRAGTGFSSGFAASLKGLAGAAGLAVGVNAFANFAKGGIAAATSLQDEMGALNVIVGEEGTAAIEAFGDKSAQAFGIAKVDALEAAHTFSTFGKSAGLAGQDLSTFATDFTSLAGDLASFNGGSTEDAITAIGGALRGETEPIRRYGVLLDAATLQQAALKLGIIENIKQALTPQQKVLAAQAEIFRQTKDAQGDFARTSDSAANSQKRLTAQLKDVQTKLGTQLLPILTKGSQALSDFITEMENGEGAGGQFVEVLQGAVDVGQQLFDLINGLPGPVKKYGAEIAIAALALSKFNSLTGSGIGALRGFTAQVTNAETRSAGLSRGLQGLGGAMRLAAGAGGAVLLANNLKSTNTQMDDFQALLGGALTGTAAGAAAGGPFGALAGAVGGTALAFFALSKQTKDSGEAAKIALPPYQQYAATLQGVSLATTEATRAMALQRLEQTGLITATRELGLTDREAVNALTGGVAARQRLAEALSNNTSLTDEQVAALEKETGALGRATQEQLEKNVATAGSAEELRKAKNALAAFMKQPSNKRISITGVEKANADITRLKNNIRDLFSLKEELTSGPGGTDALLLGTTREQSGTENFAGGFTTLNEVGTERVYLPPGTRVMTAAQTRQAEAREAKAGAPVVVGGGGNTLIVNQNYYGPTSTFERQRDAEWAARYHTAGAPVRSS